MLKDKKGEYFVPYYLSLLDPMLIMALQKMICEATLELGWKDAAPNNI